MNPRTASPSSGVDLFSDEALADPYPLYENLRASGAAVHLDRIGVWAIPRYAEVRAAAADWETFSSAGVGLAPETDISGSVLGSDPPVHDARRRTLDYGLSPRVLRQQAQASVEQRAAEVVGAALARGSFDAVGDLALPFIVSVVGDLVGLPREGRERLPDYSDGVFNAFGPANERMRAGSASAGKLVDYFLTVATPDRLEPGSAGGKVYEAVARGEVAPEDAVPLMMALVAPGLDTIVNAISTAVWLFARHPDQWDRVREDPDRTLAAAFNEVLRIESPIQLFGRLATRECELGGVTLPAGSRVALMFGSANRDARKWDDPGRFDVRRDAVDHLAFGNGVHRCAGQGLARMEFAAVMTRLAHVVRRFELEGEPERRLNNTVRGFSRLPVGVKSGP